jgi:ankyrin repeat protein
MKKRWQIFNYSDQEDASESLIYAVLAGNIEWIHIHLKNGADVNMRSNDGWTPLIEAATSHPEITRILLSAGADPTLHTEKGYTALMRAAGFGNTVVVKILIEAGVDIFARDDLGQTALDMTYGLENPETHTYLREAMRKAGQKQDKLSSTYLHDSIHSIKVEKNKYENSGNEAGKSDNLHFGNMLSSDAYTQPPRCISIFVSSTFRDMHAERDCLRNYVYPALEERLLDRGIQLEWIDLRIGVKQIYW